MICVFIIAFGFLFSIRETKDLLLKKPIDNLLQIVRDTIRFWMALCFIVMFFEAAATFPATRAWIENDHLLLMGALAYLLSKLLKKTDVFFLSLTTAAFFILSEQGSEWKSFLSVCQIAFGIGFFQICFLGMRYRLLFSKVPMAMKGWPLLCLLAFFISLTFWGLHQYVF